MIDRLDHVNLRTAQLDRMVGWYQAALGLSAGPRPDFPFGGAWLYAGDQALVHLVEVDATAPPSNDLSMEHVAFSARDLRGFLDRLSDLDAPYKLARVPGFPIIQVNVWDPDKNHLHIDFDVAEADKLGV